MSNKLLFDIGANVGAYAQARWESGEFDKIVCVEANQIAFERLRARFQHNSNIFPLFCAASDRDNQKLTFFETQATVLSTANPDWVTKPGYRFHGNSTARVVNEVEVLTTTLDKLIHFFGMPDLVKIDVEGFEETVIKGLNQKVPTLCFEWAQEMSDECLKTVDMLKNLGFEEFAMQYNDDYLFYPDAYQPITDFHPEMLATREKDWGMVWVR